MSSWAGVHRNMCARFRLFVFTQPPMTYHDVRFRFTLDLCVEFPKIKHLSSPKYPLMPAYAGIHRRILCFYTTALR